MLYYLFQYLDQLDIPGTWVFKYISFRAALAVIVSLVISMLLGGRIIKMLQKLQVGETIRDLGLDGQMQKQGTPTMGGLMILAAILIPTLLFAKLGNTYIILMIVSTIWLGLIGFADDYIKVFKKNKEGLRGRSKIIGQIGIGIIAGAMLYFSDYVVVKEKVYADDAPVLISAVEQDGELVQKTERFEWKESKSMKTTIPFVKNN